MKKRFNYLVMKYVGYVPVLVDLNSEQLKKLCELSEEEAIEELNLLYLKKQAEEEKKQAYEKKFTNPSACIGYIDF